MLVVRHDGALLVFDVQNGFNPVGAPIVDPFGNGGSSLSFHASDLGSVAAPASHLLVWPNDRSAFAVIDVAAGEIAWRGTCAKGALLEKQMLSVRSFS